MLTYFNYDSRHWRQRAEEFRRLADAITGTDAKDTMLRIVEHYEQLAAKADLQAIEDRFPAGDSAIFAPPVAAKPQPPAQAQRKAS